MMLPFMLVTRIVHLFKCWSMNWHCLLAKQNNLVIQNENENGNMIFVMWMFVARLNYRHTSLLSSLLIVCVLRILEKLPLCHMAFACLEQLHQKFKGQNVQIHLRLTNNFFWMYSKNCTSMLMMVEMKVVFSYSFL